MIRKWRTIKKFILLLIYKKVCKNKLDDKLRIKIWWAQVVAVVNQVMKNNSILVLKNKISTSKIHIYNYTKINKIQLTIVLKQILIITKNYKCVNKTYKFQIKIICINKWWM